MYRILSMKKSELIFTSLKKAARALITACLMALIILLSAAQAQTPTPESQPMIASEAEADALWQAYQAHYQQNLTGTSDNPLVTLFEPVLDTAFISADGKTAVLWLALKDFNRRILATEPGIVFALRQGDGWQIVLSSDKEWTEIQASLSESFLPASFQSAPENVPDNALNAPLTGYYLPYVKGTAHRLEGSILHFQYYPALGYPSCDINNCHYAYDFTDAGHFPMVASKAGVVAASYDGCFDGTTNCTNYIVLQDTVGSTYQIYLHLAHNTIPDYLTPGTFVDRGKYIGDTDDTGYSTSEHVHFMVVNSWWWGNGGYPWGYSADMRFADVTLNGGIPRTCLEVSGVFPFYDGAYNCNGDKQNPTSPLNDWFVSGNLGASPPTGSLTRPAAGATVAVGANSLMDVTAQTSDDVRVVKAVLIAKVNGKWRELAPRVTNPTAGGIFDWDVNLCKAGDLNGPVDVAIKLWDYEGNVAELLSLRTINVDDACPYGVSFPLIMK